MSTNPDFEDPRLSRALEQLRSVLVEGETIEAWAVQCRIFALTHRRTLIAATSGRFISLQRRLIGGFDMIDFRWQDLRDAQIKLGVFGADISFGVSVMSDLASGNPMPSFLSYQGLRKEQTQKVYRLAQAHDQAWREKRRIRELEEMRAKSGGFQFNAQPGASSAVSASVPTGDAASRLQQAKQMLDAKLITDSEYESLKARILTGI